VSQPAYQFTSAGPEAWLYAGDTTNVLLGQGGVISGKTGSSDDAGGCVSLAREMPEGNIVIVTVVGADLTYTPENMIDVDARWDDMGAVLAAMDTDFVWTTPGADETFPGLAEELSVWQMEFQDPPIIPYPNSDDESIGYQLVLGEPVETGEQGGVVVLYYGETNVGEVPVYQAGG
jgi:D-alanyl-D-alanine carboxypeptidase